MKEDLLILINSDVKITVIGSKIAIKAFFGYKKLIQHNVFILLKANMKKPKRKW